MFLLFKKIFIGLLTSLFNGSNIYKVRFVKQSEM